MSELKTDFVSFTILLFALLNFVLVTYLWPLKMGVKNVRTGTIFMFSPRCPSFDAPRYFCFHRDAYLLMRHDLYIFTEPPFFCCATILLILLQCHLLLHHDIFICTEMPFFRRFTILLKLHELLLLAKR
jgi:hypothetical protein